MINKQWIPTKKKRMDPENRKMVPDKQQMNSGWKKRILRKRTHTQRNMVPDKQKMDSGWKHIDHENKKNTELTGSRQTRHGL